MGGSLSPNCICIGNSLFLLRLFVASLEKVGGNHLEYPPHTHSPSSLSPAAPPNHAFAWPPIPRVPEMCESGQQGWGPSVTPHSKGRLQKSVPGGRSEGDQGALASGQWCVASLPRHATLPGSCSFLCRMALEEMRLISVQGSCGSVSKW